MRWKLPKRAEGGTLPPPPRRDTVPAILNPSAPADGVTPPEGTTMTEQADTTTTPAPEPRKGSKLRKLAVIIGAPALLLIGCATGAATAGGSNALPPTPTKTITKEAVPYECTKALDHADGVDAIIPRFAESSSNALTAAATQDIAGLEQVTADIRQQTAELQPLIHDYVAARDTCRAKAQR